MSSRIKLIGRLFSTSKMPPVAPPSIRRTAQQIRDEADQVISRSTRVLDAIAKEPNPTFQNVLVPYGAMENDLITTNHVLPFYQYVSASADIRSASEEVSEKLEAFEIESSKRVDVYKQIKAVFQAEQQSSQLSPIDKRFLERVMRDLRRNGLDLPDDQRAQLTALEKELSSISIKFNANLGADNSFLMFSKDELKGVPESAMEQYEVVDGKYKVTFKAPDLQPVLKSCDVEATRKTLYVASENRVPQNEPIFKRALELRAQISGLLGYKTFADNILEIRMAKTPQNVEKFLTDLAQKARPLGVKEKQMFLSIKRESQPDATEIYAWDSLYYQNKVVEREFQVDQELVSQYFEMDHTVTGMFAIFEQLMGLRFEPVALTEDQKWHDEVTCFAIYEKAPDGAAATGESFKGYLYLDMYPRDNKYGHFANFGLYKGNIDTDGTLNYPVSALVCNFPRATEKRPGLLYHRDVVTFFHELGHGIHSTLGLVKYGRFSGTSVARDFVETPSQLLENWTWDPEQLKKLSKHYQTGEPLSDDLVDALVKSKNANQATFMLRQLFFGIFDYRAHTTSPASFDLETQWEQLRNEIIGLPSTEKLHGYNQFAHLMGGYECGYYGYMWSLVFAADIWKTLFAADPLNAGTGAAYRDGILSQGSSEDADVLMHKLLGREPNNAAFLEEVGLSGA